MRAVSQMLPQIILLLSAPRALSPTLALGQHPPVLTFDRVLTCNEFQLPHFTSICLVFNVLDSFGDPGLFVNVCRLSPRDLRLRVLRVTRDGLQEISRRGLVGFGLQIYLGVLLAKYRREVEFRNAEDVRHDGRM